MIDIFRGQHEFLNNSFPVNIEYDGFIYGSVEHAFQAAKTTDAEIRSTIRNAQSSIEAKKLGRKIILQPTWDMDRLVIMKQLLTQKFELNLDLKLKLLKTGSETLTQGGMRKDQFWGVNEFGVGENRLGEMLMEIRLNIRTKEGNALDVFTKFLKDSGLDMMAEDVRFLMGITTNVLSGNIQDLALIQKAVESLS